ncbi:siderophore iron transporter ARN2 [Kluyveromyces marxianus DMKU3-1042]|uniref:Siderophore iron transporter ARN2 n=1 Tax=Kluyveromyces marxianus (strain DMKU3-1042 / BCC 29191 / NBRC 104275) TaxID=1003335 RepID=W0TBB2_KLUMD|nr:siderophore iron transporter ARN2 [Kluyveromyces marxianus DMKU3-1042]BAO40111.1 siderophore iron transporter ARN2 [Kluyveromyces marxianus DMKU3-1042]
MVTIDTEKLPEKYLETASPGDLGSPGDSGDTESPEKHLSATKSLVIRKTEILADQYQSWPYRIALLFSAFLCAYGYGLDGTLRNVYTTYATSSYQTHSLLSTVSVINLVIAAAAQIFYARLSDVFGRLTLLIVSIVFYSVGTIIQSQAYDVQRYAAGAVFYNVGMVGAVLQVILILSDFSSMRWRLLYTFVPSWPFIINTWISGNIVSAANPLDNWSWDIAMWAFIFPLSCVPLVACMCHMRWKARKTEEWKELKIEQTYYQKHGLVSTLVQLFWKLDVVGVTLCTLALGCILVPLTVAGGVSHKWNQGRIIAPFVLGWVVLLPMFIAWESKWAREPIAPAKMLKDRGIWSALAIQFLTYFVYQMAAGYLYTILIVAVDESTKAATRITSVYSFTAAVASPFFAFFVGQFKPKSGVRRLKPYIVVGVGFWLIAMGILYHFRSGKDSDKGIIGALFLWGLSSTLFTYPITVSIQSITSHENMASVTALSYTVYRVGGAVASACSGAIWTQLLYGNLLKQLDGDAALAKYAYGSPLAFVTEHPWGTATRQAVVRSYRYVQKYEVLVALIFCVPMFFFAMCLRDPPLTDEQAQKNLKEGEYVQTEDGDPIAEWISQKWGKLR